MPKWLIFSPFIVFVLVAGLLAFRYGSQIATLSETDVINHYAAQYLEAAGPGAELTDCYAQPSPEARIWIVVHCVGHGEARHSYHVTRFGNLARVERPL